MTRPARTATRHESPWGPPSRAEPEAGGVRRTDGNDCGWACPTGSPRSRASLACLGVLLLSAVPAGAQSDPRPAPPPVLLPPVAGRPVDETPPVTGRPMRDQPSPLSPQPPGPDPDPLDQPGRTGAGLPRGLRATVDALGASSGVPDGAGVSWYPSVPVRGQSAHMGLVNYQAGVTVPVSTTDAGGWYANGDCRLLSVPRTRLCPPTGGFPGAVPGSAGRQRVPAPLGCRP